MQCFTIDYRRAQWSQHGREHAMYHYTELTNISLYINAHFCFTIDYRRAQWSQHAREHAVYHDRMIEHPRIGNR
jgi:hypothetical protein